MYRPLLCIATSAKGQAMKRKEYSHRKALFGGFILRVREMNRTFGLYGMGEWYWGEWRDANTQDLIEYYKEYK